MLLQRIKLTLKMLFILNITILMNYKKMKIPNKDKSMALFQKNASALNKNFNDLQHLLRCTYKNFDAFAITKTRITKNVSLANNLNMNSCFFEFKSYCSLYC